MNSHASFSPPLKVVPNPRRARVERLVVVACFEVQPAAVRGEGGLHVVAVVGDDVGVGRGGKGPRLFVGVGRRRRRRGCGDVRRGLGEDAVAMKAIAIARQAAAVALLDYPPRAMVMPTSMQPEHDHRDTHKPRVMPGHPAEGPPVRNNITMAIALETREALECWRSHDKKGDHHRKRREEDEEKDADGAQPVFPSQPGCAEMVPAFDSSADASFLELRRCQHRGDNRGQSVRNEAMRRRPRSRSPAHGKDGAAASRVRSRKPSDT